MRKTLLLAAVAMTLSAGQASAHARLIRATPRVGARVASAPTELRLWFSETIDLAQSGIAVWGPGGARIAIGPLRLDSNDPRVVIAPLPGTLVPGAYRVQWRMTSADTHHTDGDFRFDVGP